MRERANLMDLMMVTREVCAQNESFDHNERQRQITIILEQQNKEIKLMAQQSTNCEDCGYSSEEAYVDKSVMQVDQMSAPEEYVANINQEGNLEMEGQEPVAPARKAGKGLTIAKIATTTKPKGKKTVTITNGVH